MELRGHARVRRRPTKMEQHGEVFADAVLEFETFTTGGERETTVFLATAKGEAAEVLASAEPGDHLFIHSGDWWTDRRRPEGGFVVRARLFRIELIERPEGGDSAPKRPRGGAGAGTRRKAQENPDDLEF